MKNLRLYLVATISIISVYTVNVNATSIVNTSLPACQNSDLTYGGSNADDCRGFFAGNDSYVDGLGFGSGYTLLTKSDTSEKTPLGGLDFSVTTTESVTGDWTLSWEATSGENPVTPLSFDFVGVLKAGSGNNAHNVGGWAAYLFSDEVITSIPGNGSGTFNLSSIDKNLSHLSIYARVSDVPAPGALALMGLGLIGLVATRRKTKV